MLGGSVILVRVVGEGGAGGIQRSRVCAILPTMTKAIIPNTLTNKQTPHAALLAADHGRGVESTDRGRIDKEGRREV